MDIYKILEIIGLVVGAMYLVLIIGENIWCWIFGIIGSIITIILYYHTKLYLEAILNIYYVWAGFYGWRYWSKTQKNNIEKSTVPVLKWKLDYHLINITACIVSTYVVGFLMKKYTDSPRPYIDACLAIFSFSATFMEARKVLSAWTYWFLINSASVALQFDRELKFYAFLSIVYTIMSIVGYLQWKKSFSKQNFARNLPKNS